MPVWSSGPDPGHGQDFALGAAANIQEDMLGHLEGAGDLSLGKPNLSHAGNGWSLCSASYCDQLSLDSGGSVGT